MTTGTWTPDTNSNSPNYALDTAFLKKIIQQMDKETCKEVDSVLSEEEKIEHQPCMRLTEKEWFSIIENLPSTEIITLIKFFTLAEQQFSNWQSEEKSPVIYLAKVLRRRKEPLSKDLLQWIKANSNNKFLPYGPL